MNRAIYVVFAVAVSFSMQPTLESQDITNKHFHISSHSDIDECANSVLNECDVNAECSNNVGSYDCSCYRGFTGDGYSCRMSTLILRVLGKLCSLQDVLMGTLD